MQELAEGSRYGVKSFVLKAKPLSHPPGGSADAMRTDLVIERPFAGVKHFGKIAAGLARDVQGLFQKLTFDPSH